MVRGVLNEVRGVLIEARGVLIEVRNLSTFDKVKDMKGKNRIIST